MYSNEEIGKALKTISERLRVESLKSREDIPLSNNCWNCKHRHQEEYYDQQWGRFFCGHNWCDKDKTLMDTGFYNSLHGKGHKFINNCEFYEEGKGIYDEIQNKENYPH